MYGYARFKETQAKWSGGHTTVIGMRGLENLVSVAGERETANGVDMCCNMVAQSHGFA